MSVGTIGNLLLGLVAGLAFGTIHLLWLRHASARFVARGDTGALLAGAALRLVVVSAGFAALAWVAMQPGLALFAALGGFALARGLGLWRTRNQAR